MSSMWTQTGLSTLVKRDDMIHAANDLNTVSRNAEELSVVDEAYQSDAIEMGYDIIDVNVELARRNTIEETQTLAQNNKQIDALKIEVNFLRAELRTKQCIIEQLLQLLTSTMHVTKERSAKKRCLNDSSVTLGGAATLNSESRCFQRSSHDLHQSQRIGHCLELQHDDDSDSDDDEKDFEDSLNGAYLNSSSRSNALESLIDSLES